MGSTVPIETDPVGYLDQPRFLNAAASLATSRAAQATVTTDRRPLLERDPKFLSVVGKLRPGVTPAKAEEDLTAILRRVPEEPRDVRVQLVPLKDDLVGNLRLPLVATLAASALILIVACINVAALLLARAVKRKAEIALRLSLGADLPRIAQQLVTEATILGVAGCALGLLFAWSALHILSGISSLPLPRLEDVHLNLPALATAIAIASGTPA